MPPACRVAAGRQVFSVSLGIQPTAVIFGRVVSSFPSKTPIPEHRSPLPQTSVRMASTRTLHSSSAKASLSDGISLDNSSHSTLSALPESQSPESQSSVMDRPGALGVLPLTTVIRSLVTTTISSSPRLLPPSLALMSVLAHTRNPILNPDRNPVLNFILKRTFYAQFCAGETAAEVRRTVDSLKNIGFSGVILGYAKEVVLSDAQTKHLSSSAESADAQECIRAEIESWAAGTIETVRLADPGDFVALKFTGAGHQALYSLTHNLPPSPALADAIDTICRLAASRRVRLLFDAEQQAVQAGIDDWTLDYMRKYNRSTDNDNAAGCSRAVVYGTYQAYLKATPATLSRHLAAAADGGFVLGVKLVRGAYLGSDPRHLMHDTKAETDAAYDSIAEALLRRRWMRPVADLARPPADEAGAFPDVDLVVATHNRESVRRACEILREGGLGGEGGTKVAFAQLQGMADEIGCMLVSAAKGPAAGAVDGDGEDGAPKPVQNIHSYKYLVWGSTGECMKYLLRRAHENRDAVQRTRSGRDAMRAELWRRVKSVFSVGA